MSFLEFYVSFFIYSCIGWAYESFLCSPIELKHTTNRGFLIGPYCPIYGLGTSLTWLVLHNISSPLRIFIASSILCCSMEYFIGFLLEKLFHAKWWDYRNYPFQIHGRVCLYGLIIFGIANVLIIKITTPMILFALELIPHRFIVTMAVLITFIGILDLILTISYLKRLNARLENIHQRLSKKSEVAVISISTNFHLRKVYPHSGERLRARAENFNQKMIKREKQLKKFPFHKEESI